MKDTAFYPADILLPSAERGIDLTKWAVVACDQYTSQPDYWNKSWWGIPPPRFE